jgi:DNA-binding NarL/FixJ family response regulator
MQIGRSRGVAPSVQLATRNKNGKTVWLSITHVVIPSRNAKLSSMVHIFRDVSKQVENQELISRLAELAIGAARPIPRPPAPPKADAFQEQLTPRELEVLRQMCQGKSSKTIAEDLVISRTTARNHIQSILSKLGVHTALEAVAFASNNRLISRD